MIFETKAKFENGFIVPEDTAGLTLFKSKLEPGAALLLTFEDEKAARSRKQQRTLHALLGRYARGMKESMFMVKYRAKTDLGHWLPAGKILSGELKLPKWRGTWIDLHDLYPRLHPENTIVFMRSESDYTKRQEIEFIEYVVKLCAEADIYVEDIIKEV